MQAPPLQVLFSELKSQAAAWQDRYISLQAEATPERRQHLRVDWLEDSVSLKQAVLGLADAWAAGHEHMKAGEFPSVPVMHTVKNWLEETGQFIRNAGEHAQNLEEVLYALQVLGGELESLEFARKQLSRQPEAWNRYLQIRSLHYWQKNHDSLPFGPNGDMPLSSRRQTQQRVQEDDWFSDEARRLGQSYRAEK